MLPLILTPFFLLRFFVVFCGFLRSIFSSRRPRKNRHGFPLRFCLSPFWNYLELFAAVWSRFFILESRQQIRRTLAAGFSRMRDEQSVNTEAFWKRFLCAQICRGLRGAGIDCFLLGNQRFLNSSCCKPSKLWYYFRHLNIMICKFGRALLLLTL